MNNSQSFVSSSKFYAEEHFPYGLSRSGEFTCKQVELLENHGKAYQAIHSRSREPVNEEERDFLAVCLGIREPMTVHEKAWMIFRHKTSKRPGIFSFGRRSSSMFDVDHAGDSTFQG